MNTFKDDVITLAADVPPNTRSAIVTAQAPNAGPFTMRSIVAFGLTVGATNAGFALPKDPLGSVSGSTLPTLQDVDIELRANQALVFASAVALATFSERGAARFMLDAPITIETNTTLSAVFFNRRTAETIRATVNIWGTSELGRTM